VDVFSSNPITSLAARRRALILSLQTYDPAKTEFENYADGTPDEDSNSFNGITWWVRISSKDDFPTLFQYALDTLSRLTILTECERVFSSAKKLITPERNHLVEDIIEACEYLKACGKTA
jgi:hypothetical protein